MNTFTNNGEFIRPQGYRNADGVIKDLKILIKESDIHAQCDYLETLKDTAPKGMKSAQNSEIKAAIYFLILSGCWENKFGLPHESDAVFMSTYLPEIDAAHALGVSLKQYREEYLF